MSCASQTICAIAASIFVVAVLATWGLGAIAALTLRRAQLGRDDIHARFLKTYAPLLTIAPTIITSVLACAWLLIASWARPVATSTILHALMWFLALGGMAFIVQAFAAWAFVRGWDNLSSKHHVTVGYIYAFASLIPVLTVSVIASFMTMPGKWVETFNLWDALMAPLAAPLFVIAAAWGLVIGSTIFMLIANAAKHLTPAEHDELEKSTRPALLLSATAVPFLPMAVIVLAPLNISIPSSLIYGIVLAAAALCFIVAARFVRRERLGFTSTLVTALVAIAAAISVTQSIPSVNAPYTIRNYLYNNEVVVHDLPILKRKGVLTDAVGIVPQGIDLTHTESAQRGRWAFLASGYRCSCSKDRLMAIASLVGKDAMRKVLRRPNTMELAIPPFMGTAEELDDVVEYLTSPKEEDQ